MQHRSRMRIEGHNSGRQIQYASALDDPAHDQLMREMEPIKHAKREDAGRFDAGFVYVAKDFHRIETQRSCHEGTKTQRLTRTL